MAPTTTAGPTSSRSRAKSVLPIIRAIFATRGIGGRVGMVFTVGANGRVTSCTVTRSSGVPELDSLTCRLIQQRFRYRPSTDRYGRPIPDEVEGEHDWVAGRG